MLGSGVSGLLTYAMGKKFLRSGKFMPAGFIATMGAAAFVYNLIEATMRKKEEPAPEPVAEVALESASERPAADESNDL